MDHLFIQLFNLILQLSHDFPDIKEPYYTWDGRVIEKSSRR